MKIFPFWNSRRQFLPKTCFLRYHIRQWNVIKNDKNLIFITQTNIKWKCSSNLNVEFVDRALKRNWVKSFYFLDNMCSSYFFNYRKSKLDPNRIVIRSRQVHQFLTKITRFPDEKLCRMFRIDTSLNKIRFVLWINAF